MKNHTLDLCVAYNTLSTKAKNRLRFCSIATIEELEEFLSNKKIALKTEGIGPVTLAELENFYLSVKNELKIQAQKLKNKPNLAKKRLKSTKGKP